jgi:light-regulated signal transduction histidine kinase (bacteriophytochrome)
MMDITEQKRAEEELKDFAAKLERSNNELQEFASVASHDLQEPLRKFRLSATALKVKCGDSLNEDGRDYLERMQNAAGRMQTLINDLLTFSRVSTQAQPFLPVNLRQVATSFIRFGNADRNHGRHDRDRRVGDDRRRPDANASAFAELNQQRS